MSIESAAAFYDKLESDESLTARIQELGDKEKIAAYVRDELGYDFTQEEMQKVVFKRNPEMTDEEIEMIVGGTGAGHTDFCNLKTSASSRSLYASSAAGS